MFISKSSFAHGINVELSNDPDDVVRVQFGTGDERFAMYFSRVEALELLSGLEKAIHKTAEVTNEMV